VSTPTHDISPPDGSPQIASSPDESYSSSSWLPTDSPSGSTSSWSPQHHVSPPAGSPGPSQDHVPSPPSSKFKYLSELMSTPTHVTPSPDVAPQIVSSPDKSHSSSSWAPTYTHSGQTKSWSPHRYVSPAGSPGPSQDHVPSPPNLGDHLPSDSHSLSSVSTAKYYLGSPDLSSTDKSHLPNLGDHLPSDGHSSSSVSTAEYYLGSPDLSSTDKSHPPAPGPTDNHPPPASSSNPGPSTEPNPLPSAKRPRPEEHGFESFLSKTPKGKFKRRFSGSGALNAAQGDLQGTFNSRGVRHCIFPSSPVNKRP
jgi:hypothetical protein